MKAYAPIGVRFWGSQEIALQGLKDFAEDWFARHHKPAQAALEAAKHMGDAATASDVLREYQSWLTAATELFVEDGKAYQPEVLRAGAGKEVRQTEERRTG